VIKAVLLAPVLVALTTLIHAAAMILVLQGLRARYERRPVGLGPVRRAMPVASIVLVMSLGSLAEAAVWAGAYLWLGAIDRPDDALYFSMVTLTTLGYGDIVLTAPWRLLAAFQAAIGIIMFGWTTALVFAAVHRLYLAPAADPTPRA